MTYLLNDLVQLLMEKKPILNNVGDLYLIKSIDYVTDQLNNTEGWKAIISGHGCIYSSINLAVDKEAAILNTLLAMQSMGKFSGYKLSENQTDQINNKKKKQIPLKKIPTQEPNVEKEDIEKDNTVVEVELEPSSDESSVTIYNNNSPEEIERSTILKIVTRTSKK